MKSFGKGFVFGTIATVSAIAGCVVLLTKTKKIKKRAAKIPLAFFICQKKLSFPSFCLPMQNSRP